MLLTYGVNVVFLLIVWVLNTCVISITVQDRCLKICPHNRLMLSTYIGNLIGGTSVFINNIYGALTASHGIIGNRNLDRDFCLYIGVSVNVLTLLANSHVRYTVITSTKLRFIHNTHTNNQLLVKYIVPTWIISICCSIIAVVTVKIDTRVTCLILLLLCGMPISIAVAFYVKLLRYLKNCKVSTPCEASNQKLGRAEFLILLTTISYSIFLVFGITLVLFEYIIFPDNNSFADFSPWLSQVLYTSMFTIESLIFLYKTPEATNKITMCYRRMKGKSSINPTIYTINKKCKKPIEEDAKNCKHNQLQSVLRLSGT